MQRALGLGLVLAGAALLGGCEKSPSSPAPAPLASVGSAKAGGGSQERAPVEPKGEAKGDAKGKDAPVVTVSVPEVAIDPTRESKVKVTWKTPAGTGVNADAPFKVRWTTSEGLESVPPDTKGKGGDAQSGFEVPVKPMSGVPGGTLAGTVEVVVCDVETHAVCVPVKRKIEMSFRSAKGAPSEIPISVPLPEARPRS